MSILNKITVMAVLGGLGATGGAGLGEALFRGDTPQRSEPRKVCLLFDISRSMEQAVARHDGPGIMSQLEALQDAATDFVARQDLSLDKMALTTFSWDARVVTGLTQDAASLSRAIEQLRAAGGTNLGLGLDRARGLLENETGERWILLFTDGKPESSSTHERPEAAALTAAAQARDKGIKIVAIGTGLADAELLAEATGSPDNVIVSDPQKLADAFRRTEEVMNVQMLASTANADSFQRNAALTGLWAGLIAIGAALGMVIGQNFHLHRRFLRLKEIMVVGFGGVVTGLLAGTTSQSLFWVLSGMPEVQVIARIAAWMLLGLGIGYGMGFFMPNLRRARSGIAGALGGVAAAAGFLALAPNVGDMPGRLLGAGILGLCTGLTTVLVETVARKAWLVVHWSPKESSQLPLGATPILVGSGSNAHVLLPEDQSPAPVVAKIRLHEGVIGLEDPQSGANRVLQNGETLSYGKIKIDVKASESSRAAAAIT